MLDRFVYGQVERISPEAPIPVLHFTEETLMLGGAANVARNIASLGGQAVLVGVIGQDPSGDTVAEQLVEAVGIEDRLLRVAGHPTTVKTRFVSGGQQIMRLDVEIKLANRPDVTDQLLDVMRDALPGLGAIVLSDYAKGVLSPDLVGRAIAIAQEAGIPVIVDPKSRDVAIYRGASVLTPNALEASQATGIDATTNEGADDAAEALCRLAGVKAVVLTRGPRGMTIFEPGQTPAPVHIPTAASEVFDVSGAGDTVVATLSLGIAAGRSVERAAGLANIAAGVAVAKLGTAAVHASELERALLENAGEDSKILSRAALVDKVRHWQAQGKKVGFANGCFDLIHPGHISILKKARAACDRLVVALNADESVRRLKGPTRPLQNETARSIVMASIGAVDAVTLFGEDTPLELIEAIRPDVLVKGADYRIDQVVGHDRVGAWGGKVLLIPLEEGHSTTNIVARAG
jgi:D-beta-D-heptose 7-phosphate kinase/D-beta-D-heptose 1-phosphate adenosyltransferase